VGISFPLFFLLFLTAGVMSRPLTRVRAVHGLRRVVCCHEIPLCEMQGVAATPSMPVSLTLSSIVTHSLDYRSSGVFLLFQQDVPGRAGVGSEVRCLCRFPCSCPLCEGLGGYPGARMAANLMLGFPDVKKFCRVVTAGNNSLAVASFISQIAFVVSKLTISLMWLNQPSSNS
jgi:hypothetical protein